MCFQSAKPRFLASQFMAAPAAEPAKKEIAADQKTNEIENKIDA